jgi:hypothetical protein
MVMTRRTGSPRDRCHQILLAPIGGNPKPILQAATLIAVGALAAVLVIVFAQGR